MIHSVASKLRVLLVDDQPLIRLAVEFMLGETAEITDAADGAAGVEAFRRRRFDVVLMDMDMPVMDGLTAVRELRRLEAVRNSGRTPIIMFTSNDLPKHRAASAQAGADLHLGKPTSAELLFGAIHAALSGQTVLDGDRGAAREHAPTTDSAAITSVGPGDRRPMD